MKDKDGLLARVLPNRYEVIIILVAILSMLIWVHMGQVTADKSGTLKVILYAYLVILGGPLVGLVLACFKLGNQYLYGIVELILSALITSISVGKLAKVWDTGADRWPAMATLVGAIYLSSRAWDNIIKGKEAKQAEEPKSDSTP